MFSGRRYHGYRYGPESEMKYEYTSHHWLQLCDRLAFIIVFEVRSAASRHLVSLYTMRVGSNFSSQGQMS